MKRMLPQVTFVSFYVERGNAVYLRCLAILAESIRLSTRGRSSLLVLTDRPDVMKQASCRVVLNPDRPFLMERLRCYREFVEQARSGQAVVFCDPDVIVQEDPGHYFLEAFDVTVTIRPEADQWLLGGLFLAYGRQAGSLLFFRALEALAEDPTVRAYPNYSDQVALLRWAQDLPRTAGTHDYRGVTIRLLSATKHHWWPKNRSTWVGRIEGYPFLHFKGPRKGYMADYWHVLQHTKRFRQAARELQGAA